MTPERWELIGETYHAALEYEGGAREAFLDKACAGDEDLRREVESLILASKRGDEFIEAPALNDAARLMIGDIPDWPDWKDRKQIGHYQLRTLLGSGGMGEVYLARDTRLNRKVAVKLLHPETARDSVAKERLLREARAAAALNHPNIVAIHSIEEVDEVIFIVMEYVKGQTLTEVIAESRLGFAAALGVGAEIADALAAAHARGLIHRDIKPGNVIITPQGQVKLLDFGLARVVEGVSNPDSGKEEVLTRLTAEGRVLGTAAYMSPEQVRGEELDVRSDIFSLGAVLYEAVTGKLPFSGSAEKSVMDQIVNSEPTLPTSIIGNVSPEFDSIIKQALNKEKTARYQSATEFAQALSRLQQTLEGREPEGLRPQKLLQNEVPLGLGTRAQETSTAALPRKTGSRRSPPQVSRRNKWPIYVTIAAILATGFLVFSGRLGWFGPATPGARSTETRLTNTGNVGNASAALSPDGKYTAYALHDSQRKSSLWLRQIQTSSTFQLVSSAEVAYFGMTFSLDGNHVYYVQRALDERVPSLYRIPLLGGEAKRVLGDIDGPVSFAPDGRRFVFRRSAPGRRESTLVVADANGARPEQIAVVKAPEFFGDPAWSPKGEAIVCAAGQSDGGDNRYLIQISVGDWTSRVITKHKWRWIGNVAWLADGKSLLMIATDSPANPYRVWQLSYPEGEATRVTRNSTTYSRLSLTSDAKTLLVLFLKRSTSMWIAPVGEPQQAKKLTFGSGGFRSYFSWASNGKIVFDSEVSGSPDISVMNEDGTDQVHLLGALTGKGTSLYPAVSPDGRYVVFAFDVTGERHLWRMDIDGRNSVRLTDGDGEDHPHCSPDGKWVVYSAIGGAAHTLARVPSEGGTQQALTTVPSRHPSVSPDGRFISYLSSSEDGYQWRIAIMPFEGGSPVRTFSQPVFPAYPAKWSRDGSALAYLDPSQEGVWLQPLDGSPPRRISDSANDLIFGFEWSPEGDRLAIVRGIWERDLILIKDPL